MIHASNNSQVKKVEMNIGERATVNNIVLLSLEEKAPLKIRHGVRDPVESFFGRVEFLDKLHSSIQSQKDDEGTEKLTVLSQMKVISGLGGVGKTETARKYIVQYAEFYDNFIWINSESEESLTQSFLQLAVEKLDINIYQTETGAENTQQKQRPFNDILEEVYNKLCVQVTLIIFDNADGKRSRSNPSVQQNRGKRSTRKMARSMAELQPFLPTSILPPLKRPFILVTSRNQDFGGLDLQEGQIVSLDVFKNEESCQFIIKQLKLDGTLQKNQEDALALGKLLGHLPLALQQAVAYIREEIENTKYGPNPFTIQDYIKLYQAEGQRRDLLDFESDTDYEWTLYTTWKITLKKIKEQGPVEGPLAVEIIKAMSFLYADNIPDALILDIFKNKDLQQVDINRGLNLLKKYSMIKHHLENSNDGTNINFLSIHRQVQHVTLERLKEKEELSKFLDTILLEPCQNFIKNLPLSSAIYKTVLENLYSICEISNQILDQEKEGDPGDQHQHLLNFQEKVAGKFAERGHVNRAVSLFRQLVTRQSESGKVSIRSWCLHEKLANALVKKGETEEALKLLQSVTAVLQPLIPKQDLINPQIMTLIASSFATGATSMPDMDEVNMENVSQTVLQVLNLEPNDPASFEVQTFFNNLHSLNDKSQLFKAFAATANPMILRSFNQAEAGNIREAMETITRILASRDNGAPYHVEHRDAASEKEAEAKVFLYLTCLQCDRFTEAANIFDNVEKEAQNTPGSMELLETLRTLQSIAISQRVVQTKVLIAKAMITQLKFEEALQLLKEIHDKEMPALGFASSETAVVQSLIATTLHLLGRYGEAEDLGRQIETGMTHQTDPRETDPGDHLGLSFLWKMQRVPRQIEQGQGDRALDMIIENLRVSISKYGSDHPMTLIIQSCKAQVLLSLERYAEALPILKGTYEAQKSLHGEDHFCTLTTFGDLLVCQVKMRDQRNKGTILASLRSIWDKQLAKLGPDHPSTKRAASNLVQVLGEIEQSEETLDTLKLLEGHGSQYSPEHMQVLIKKVGVLMRQGQVDQALSTNEKAYAIHLKMEEKDPELTAILQHNMAVMKSQLGRIDEAIQHCEEVNKVNRQFLSLAVSKEINTENLWIDLLVKQERYDHMLVAIRDMCTRNKITLGPDHPKVLEMEKDLDTTAILKRYKDLKNTLIFSKRAKQVFEAGHFSQALDYYEMVFELRRVTLGIGHRDQIATRHSMAYCLCRLGKFEDAVKMSMDLNETMEAVLGRGHSLCELTHKNLGAILEMAEAPLDDRKRDLVQVDRMMLEDHHKDTLKSMENLTDVLVGQKDFQETLQVYEKLKTIGEGTCEYDKILEEKILLLFLTLEENC